MTENNQEIIIVASSAQEVEAYRPWYSVRGASIEAIIGAWLDEKFKLSKSDQTKKKYRATIADFRGILQAEGLDMLFDAEERRLDFVGTIADAAQVFLSWRSPSSQFKDTRDEPASATQAQRLHILSSFYKFAIKRRHMVGTNPIETVDKPKVKAYASARAIPQTEVERRLASINPYHEEGAQALAILAVLLSTGRRVSEVEKMRRRDLVIDGERITVHFPRTKGGKTISDTLTPEVSILLARWLVKFYGDFSSVPTDAPIWVHLRKNSRGQALGYQGIAGIVKTYLGTTKVHATRHTFAALMRKAGADIKDIQERLGHASIATTGEYMQNLSSGENIFAGQLTELLGLKNKRF